MKHALVFALLCACDLGGFPPMNVARLGGNTTVDDATVNAFGQPARGLTQEEEDAFFVGNALFNRNWVTAPASTEGTDGLGPTFNALSCAGCHFKDGRGEPPAEGEKMQSMLVRLSVPGVAEDGGPVPHPIYGAQLNDHAILGVPAEGWARITYEEIAGKYKDGTPYSLRKPTYELVDLAFGPADDVLMSPRVANHMIGLGLLEAIEPADILDYEDLGDGISGRANMVYDVASGTMQLGRFGWKANQPSLRQQVQGALLGDIGITSPLFGSENCPPAQTACVMATNGGAPEIDQQKIDRIIHYSATLAVPAQRVSEEAKAGQAVFERMACAACHRMHFRTSLSLIGALDEQDIHPFTDLLLHDMGDELADGRPDYGASGNEWRTPPLWGLGLVEHVNKHTTLLHDGRARDFAEAILWHGGEGQAARDRFVAAPAKDRDALITFLRSL